ncbi:ribosomal protein S5 domain 2-like protein [Tilletiaria anomala UBC 951]|uniref:Ribosomal protein S5 domain 2-like protein n=1 Tax=Tilletiaria anomala (strain ATCC 24038 / CBS 436.72 / UBC 951) TaxID=1037660 RepID=A0A066VIX6_TILAU|nr:ribosomal protein S5 domain 2-like protein [Tilletiaria anomala UBC 951]KDN41426.1 ribosomal protein S5 domain 2-like protein [Tilletiaria anomala UBC 951]
MSALTASEKRLVLQLLRHGSTSSARSTVLACAPRQLHSSASSPFASPSKHSDASRSAPAYHGRYMPEAAALASGGGMQLPEPKLRPKPPMQTYYTARPTYIATLLRLADLTRRSKRALEQAYILPPNSAPPSVAAAAAGGARSGTLKAWLPPAGIAQKLSMPSLKASQYRRIIAHLSALARYRSLVSTHLPGIDPTLAKEVEEAFADFARPGGSQDFSVPGVVSSSLAGAERQEAATSAGLDAHGRAYAMGRRKESSARVWIVPTPSSPPSTIANRSGQLEEQQASVVVGQVLVNNATLGEYFSRIDHRERVMWPLKLAGKLGVFNVFALVRGGGNTGQAGAVAHALAKALAVAAQAGLVDGGEEEVQRIRAVLLRDGVLRRDPRMVERKKTGLVKSRKARTWVKR